MDGAGDDLYGLALNVAFELVPSVAVTPELQWRRDGSGDDDFGGVMRAQTSF